MKRLVCSDGHTWDPEKITDRWFKGPKRPGDRCGEELSFDWMAGGLTRCRKILREEKSEDISVDENEGMR